MMVKPGSHLGQYEIVEPIGAGGMGEVWRARDTHLDRDVAIKVLPASMTRDPERIVRFEREAKLLGSLNHGNIAVIHGFDNTDDIHYLVMEFVEGETLSARLEQGPLTVEEALPVARQMAEALEAAHDKGVIHRDLKPGNVMLRPDRSVKVLDFGLAKGTGSEVGGILDESSRTITAEHTAPGIILGTAAYMSPEQARGRPLDKRTDIWSFGLILFECLTGERLFKGDSAAESMGAIMHKEPDWSLLPPETPPTIQLLLRRCLTKDRKRRLHDIADARLEIDEAISDPTSSSLGLAAVAMADQARERPPRWRVASGLAAAFVLGAVIMGALAMIRQAPDDQKNLRRFEFASDLKPRRAEISPDGSTVAFASGDSVYVRELDAVGTRLLWTPGDGGAVWSLFWSPDSRLLGVQTDDKIWRIAIANGQATRIASSPELFNNLTWSDDGFLVGSNLKDGSLIRIPDRGGAVETLVEPKETEIHFHGGAALPGGRGYLIVPHVRDGEAQVLTLLTADGVRRDLFEADEEMNGPAYSPTGHILFTLGLPPKGIWALPFSLDDLSVTGEPFLVLPDQDEFSVSDTGDLVYTKPNRNGGNGFDLVWVDRSGAVQGKVGPAIYGAGELSISQDGQRVAVSAEGLNEGRGDSKPDIWVVDLGRGLATRLATEEGYQSQPIWSPDDRRIAYVNLRALDDVDVSARASDGSGAGEVLFDDSYFFSMNDDWSTAALMVGSLMENTWISTQQIGDPSSRREFQSGAEWDTFPVLRPGGHLIAYMSGAIITNEMRLFLRRFPAGEGRWQVSRNFVIPGARWNRAGDRLYFVETDRSSETMMEVAVTIDDDRIELGAATPLFSMTDNRYHGFDIAPDGDRFLILRRHPKSEESQAAEGIVIVQNWFEEFRQE